MTGLRIKLAFKKCVVAISSYFETNSIIKPKTRIEFITWFDPIILDQSGVIALT